MNALATTMLKTRDAVDLAGATATDDVTHTQVPLKPTAAMLANGSRAGGVSVEVAWKIYLAMIREA
ncbi:hypothetical protein [Azospirillum sp.]|uniref:hypothetical protein n=1 Tax=Azospirillum sp. TaxID=34012 RepID=UPI002D4BEF6F|nr:hypothetical protein [Azospirillum sp.]HYD71472.1 hypothetical protein [Azospirillum sp.]